MERLRAAAAVRWCGGRPAQTEGQLQGLAAGIMRFPSVIFLKCTDFSD